MNATRTMQRRCPTALQVLAIGLCVLAVARIHGDEALYGIAGHPVFEMGDPFPVVLYRVQNGALAKVRTIATRRQNAWVVKSYPEKGFVFVVSDGAAEGWYLVDILDLADMSKERSVDFDLCGGCVYGNARLLDRNGRVIFYVQAGRYYRESQTLVSQSLGLDMHRGAFVNDIDFADVTYLHHAGAQSGGVDGSDFVRGIHARAETPDQPYVGLNEDRSDLNWRLPAWFSMPEGGGLIQNANNDHVRVLSSLRGDAGQWLVFDKAAERWSSVPLSVFPPGGVRVLRRWLVREDSRPGYDAAAWPDRDGAGPASGAGAREPRFPPAVQRMGRREETPTGVLQFFDTRTATLTEHDTGHPDSEVLLIDEHDAAYFRVDDELRRADLDGGGLANEELVAKGPELLGVHWLVRGVD